MVFFSYFGGEANLLIKMKVGLFLMVSFSILFLYVFQP